MGASAGKSQALGGAHESASGALLAYFDGLHKSDVGRFREVWHAEGHLLGVGPDGALVLRDTEAFCSGIAARTPSDTEDFTRHDRILSLAVYDSMAAAKVQIALPPAPNSPTPTTSPTLYTDFLVLLRGGGGRWQIISKVFSSQPLEGGGEQKRPLPKDAAEAAEAVWELYMGGGRTCDREKMGSIFHADARLTFATADGATVVLSQEDFLGRVAERWTRADLPHARCAHLKDDPRAESRDELLGVDLAGPSVALVTLRVGYPPVVYTDFLSLLKLDGPGMSRSGWWIAAKSSCNEPFLADEAASAD